jgi:hypothetical protein
MTKEGEAGPEIRVEGSKTAGRTHIETATIRKEADPGAEIGSDEGGQHPLQKEGERILQEEIKDLQANLKMTNNFRDPNLQGKTRPTKSSL